MKSIVSCAQCGKRYRGQHDGKHYLCSSCGNIYTFPEREVRPTQNQIACSNCWTLFDRKAELHFCSICGQKMNVELGGVAEQPEDEKLKERLQQLESELISRETSIEAFRQQNEKLQCAQLEAAEKLEEKRQQCEALQAKFEVEQEKFQETNAKLQERIEELQGSLEAQELIFSSLQEQKEDWSSERAELRSRLERMNEAHLLAESANHAALQQRLEQTEQRLREAEAQSVKFETELLAARAELADRPTREMLESDLHDITERLQQAQWDRTALEENLRQTAQMHAKLERGNLELANAFRALQLEHQSLQQQLAATTSDYGEAKSVIAALRKQHSEFQLRSQQRLQTLQQALQQFERQARQSSEELCSALKQLETLASQQMQELEPEPPQDTAEEDDALPRTYGSGSEWHRVWTGKQNKGQ